MTCTDARQRLLSADLTALRGESDQALRTHLDGCAECAADAARIIEQTHQLATAVAARELQSGARRGSRRRTVLLLAPVGVAAALTLIAFGLRRNEVEPAPAVIAKQPPVVRTSVSNGDTDRVSSAPRRTPHGVASTAATPVHRGRDTDVAALPVISENDVPMLRDETPAHGVSVTVGGNQRAAIIATSNPNVTVVWLSRGPQR